MFLILLDPSTSPPAPVKQFSSDVSERLVLGRASKSDSSTSDPTTPRFRTSDTKVMSSSHAAIHWEGEYAFLTDLNSTNGTVLVRNGDEQKLKPEVPYRIFPNDRVIFGRPVTQRVRGATPVVNQPLTLLAKFETAPVFAKSLEMGSCAPPKPVSASLLRTSTATDVTWLVESDDASNSEDEGQTVAKRRVDADGANSSKPGHDISIIESSVEVVDFSSPHRQDRSTNFVTKRSTPKRGFGLSEEDLLDSGEVSPVGIAQTPLPHLNESQLGFEPNMAMGSHLASPLSPMELDSDRSPSPVNRSPSLKANDHEVVGLPSPVSPEFQSLPIESQCRLGRDETAMPPSTNPPQKKVGRTLLDLWRAEPDALYRATGPPINTLFGPMQFLQPIRDQMRLSSAFSEQERHEVARSNLVADTDLRDNNLLSQATSDLASRMNTARGRDSSPDAKELTSKPTGRPEVDALSRGSSGDAQRAVSGAHAEQTGSTAPANKETMHETHGHKHHDELWRAASAEMAEEDVEDDLEPPLTSSPVTGRIRRLFEDQVDEAALIAAAETDSLDAFKSDREATESNRQDDGAIEEAMSPTSERIAALVEDQDELFSLIFEAEHTPDDIVVESYSELESLDGEEHDVRELNLSPRCPRADEGLDAREDERIVNSVFLAASMARAASTSSDFPTSVDRSLEVASKLPADLPVVAASAPLYAHDAIEISSSGLRSELNDDRKSGEDSDASWDAYGSDASAQYTSDGSSVVGSHSAPDIFGPGSEEEMEEEEGDEEPNDEQTCFASGSSKLTPVSRLSIRLPRAPVHSHARSVFVDSDMDECDWVDAVDRDFDTQESKDAESEVDDDADFDSDEEESDYGGEMRQVWSGDMDESGQEDVIEVSSEDSEGGDEDTEGSIDQNGTESSGGAAAAIPTARQPESESDTSTATMSGQISKTDFSNTMHPAAPSEVYMAHSDDAHDASDGAGRLAGNGLEKVNLASDAVPGIVLRESSPPVPPSAARKRRLFEVDLEDQDEQQADPTTTQFPHAPFIHGPQSGGMLPASGAGSVDPRGALPHQRKRRRLDLPYKSFALGVVAGVFGAVAGLSALGAALESTE